MFANSVKIASSLLLLALLTPGTQSNVHPLPPYVGLPTQAGLTQLFFNSRVTRRDPSISVACFAGYIAESNLIGEQYSNYYGMCLMVARKGREGIDNDFLPMRKKIDQTAGQVCEALNRCAHVNGTLEAFNCHASVGSNNTISTYTISSNASESATLLQERYRVIDLQHEQCNSAAERRYVESTSSNYNYLQACLDGKVKPKEIPTTTTSTTTTTTTTTTTEAPTTTEEALVSTTDKSINLEAQFKQLLNSLN